MVSFYGRSSANSGGGGGVTPEKVNVGITAQQGYTNYPINLYSLADGNYNLIGSVSYGDNKRLNFLSYKTFVVETIEGTKYASYDTIENDKPYKNIIKMTSATSAEVIKIDMGGDGSFGSIINDDEQGINTTFSSAKIVELLSWKTSKKGE